MRRLIPFVILLLAPVLAACGAEAPVIPTAAQLPTVTPTTIPPTATATLPPTAIPTEAATDAPFFTATPPNVGGGDDGSIRITPTPEGGSDDTPVSEGPCALTAQQDALDGVDLAALNATHSAFIADLRTAAAEVAGWSLLGETGDGGTSSTDSLPLATLRFHREGPQAAFILVSPAPDALRTLLATCLTEADMFRTGDIAADATITVEALALGDESSLAVIVQPVADAAEGSPSDLITEVYSVLTGDVLLQYISIPALDEAMGQQPVERADAEALLSALVDVVGGL